MLENTNLNQPNSIIFIDPNVLDYQTLVSETQGAHVFVLDLNRDGVQQITEILEQHSNLASVHILSHGDAGTLQLGNTQLNSHNLSIYNSDLEKWSHSLEDGADILFYGCNVAKNEDGLKFVETISNWTGADIAASNNLTGSTSLGGDWNLEVTAGKIESVLALNPSLIEAYQGTLNTGTGLKAEYFDNIDFTNLKQTRIDSTINFDWGDGSPDPTIGVDTFSARWTGQIQAKYSETYTFYTTSDDGVRLWVNGQQVINRFVDQAPTEAFGTIALVAGQKYDIQLEYYERGGGAVSRLSWSSTSQAKEIIPQSQLYAPLDNIAPTASLNAANLTNSNSNSNPYTFTVTYSDNTAVNVSSIDNNDVRVTGPNSFSQLATLVSVDNNVNGSPRIATYQVNAPGGTWDPSDNGTYNIALQANQISDLNGNSIGAANLGSFQANRVAETPPGTGTGLKAEYFDNIDFTNLKLTRTDATVNFDWGDGSPDPTIGVDTFSARWTGQIQAKYSETYTFYTTSDDGVRLWVNGQQVINRFVDQAPTEAFGTIALAAGQKYDIQLEYYERGGGAVSQLSWSSANQAKEIIPQSQLYSSTTPTVDTTPPTATLIANNLTSSSSSAYTFTVTYSDNTAVNVASIDNSDIRVTGPNGFSQLATRLSLDNNSNGTPRTATYQINAPDGTWDLADNGNYTIALQTNQISDLNGNVAVAATLGNFQVNIPTTPPSTTLPINFTSFANVADLQLNGDAVQSGNVLRLTPAQTFKRGSAFFKNALAIENNTSFQTQFQFRLGGGQGTGGADGFTFMLQNTATGINTLGGAGGALAYNGTGVGSMAIEFDTYKNQDEGYSDIDNNHIAILRDGNVVTALATQNAPIDLNNGNLINAWIDYNGSTDRLEVFLASNNIKPNAALLSYTIDLASVLGSRAYAGFGAGTGGLTNSQDIESWQLSTSIATPTVDTTPPTATLIANNLTSSSSSAYTFTVTYSDNTAVNVASIDNSDIRVTGPNGFSQLATRLSLDNNSNGTPRTATYQINAPDGTWDLADNGNYTIALQTNQISDLNGNVAVAATLGNFQVNIPTTPPSTTLPINFTSFANVADLQLNGDAVQSGNVLRLTPAQTFKRGSAFFKNALAIENNTSFQTQFQFRLGGGQGTGGADGFTFMLQNTATGINTLGGAGGALAYNGTGVGSMAIEFDTYKNQDEGYSDIDNNHIAILRDGNVVTALATQNAPIDLNNGNLINAWIDYNGSTDRLEVFLASNNIKPNAALLSYTIDLASVLGSRAYAGFGAGTGGLTNSQDIESWQLSTSINNNPVIGLNQNNFLVDENNNTIDITLQRTGNTTGTSSVEYSTYDDTAIAGRDYTTVTGTVTFAPGETSKTLSIPILNDALVETDEAFKLTIDRAEGAELGTPRTATITILDDDGTDITFTESFINENNGQAIITVTRGNRTVAASVDYTTIDGTAKAGSDYTATSGRLNFASGERTKTIVIPLINDTIGESNESFSLKFSNPVGLTLNTKDTAVINIIDDDFGNFVTESVATGLASPTAFDWTPNGNRMYIAQKDGVVRVLENGTLLSTPFIDIRSQVNNTRDRGLLSIAVHPEFSTKPYIYLLFTYDPPEVNGRTGLAGPDGNGNRPSRLIRVTADPATNYTTAIAGSEVILLGKNSTWQNTSRPDGNSTDDFTIAPSGITASGANIQDYLATDSESHSIGMVRFGTDGSLFVSNGDGTSYNRVDPRAVRVQDIDNLSGKILRIDPLTGQGLPDNPFYNIDPTSIYNNDPNSNRSKVYDYGLRNPFRFTINKQTNTPFIGDVGWTTWEEVNTGRGVNFGWPYFEGGNGVSIRTRDYSSLPEAQAFYASGKSVTAGIYARNHSEGATALIMGDFYTGNAFPSVYQGALFYTDIGQGIVNALILDNNNQVTSVRQFATGMQGIAQITTGLDSNLYFVNLFTGVVGRWRSV
jgi:glucose/arabinose dehydrogenase